MSSQKPRVQPRDGDGHHFNNASTSNNRSIRQEQPATALPRSPLHESRPDPSNNSSIINHDDFITSQDTPVYSINSDTMFHSPDHPLSLPSSNLFSRFLSFLGFGNDYDGNTFKEYREHLLTSDNNQSISNSSARWDCPQFSTLNSNNSNNSLPLSPTTSALLSTHTPAELHSIPAKESVNRLLRPKVIIPTVVVAIVIAILTFFIYEIFLLTRITIKSIELDVNDLCATNSITYSAYLEIHNPSLFSVSLPAPHATIAYPGSKYFTTLLQQYETIASSLQEETQKLESLEAVLQQLQLYEIEFNSEYADVALYLWFSYQFDDDRFLIPVDTSDGAQNWTFKHDDQRKTEEAIILTQLWNTTVTDIVNYQRNVLHLDQTWAYTDIVQMGLPDIQIKSGANAIDLGQQSINFPHLKSFVSMARNLFDRLQLYNAKIDLDAKIGIHIAGITIDQDMAQHLNINLNEVVRSVLSPSKNNLSQMIREEYLKLHPELSPETYDDSKGNGKTSTMTDFVMKHLFRNFRMQDLTSILNQLFSRFSIRWTSDTTMMPDGFNWNELTPIEQEQLLRINSQSFTVNNNNNNNTNSTLGSDTTIFNKYFVLNDDTVYAGQFQTSFDNLDVNFSLTIPALSLTVDRVYKNSAAATNTLSELFSGSLSSGSPILNYFVSNKQMTELYTQYIDLNHMQSDPTTTDPQKIQSNQEEWIKQRQREFQQVVFNYNHVQNNILPHLYSTISNTNDFTDMIGFTSSDLPYYLTGINNYFIHDTILQQAFFNINNSTINNTLNITDYIALQSHLAHQYDYSTQPLCSISIQPIVIGRKRSTRVLQADVTETPPKATAEDVDGVITVYKKDIATIKDLVTSFFYNRDTSIRISGVTPFVIPCSTPYQNIPLENISVDTAGNPHRASFSEQRDFLKSCKLSYSNNPLLRRHIDPISPTLYTTSLISADAGAADAGAATETNSTNSIYSTSWAQLQAEIIDDIVVTNSLFNLASDLIFSYIPTDINSTLAQQFNITQSDLVNMFSFQPQNVMSVTVMTYNPYSDPTQPQLTTQPQLAHGSHTTSSTEPIETFYDATTPIYFQSALGEIVNNQSSILKLQNNGFTYLSPPSGDNSSCFLQNVLNHLAMSIKLPTSTKYAGEPLVSISNVVINREPNPTSTSGLVVPAEVNNGISTLSTSTVSTLSTRHPLSAQRALDSSTPNIAQTASSKPSLSLFPTSTKLTDSEPSDEIQVFEGLSIELPTINLFGPNATTSTYEENYHQYIQTYQSTLNLLTASFSDQKPYTPLSRFLFSLLPDSLYDAMNQNWNINLNQANLIYPLSTASDPLYHLTVSLDITVKSTLIPTIIIPAQSYALYYNSTMLGSLMIPPINISKDITVYTPTAHLYWNDNVASWTRIVVDIVSHHGDRLSIDSLIDDFTAAKFIASLVQSITRKLTDQIADILDMSMKNLLLTPRKKDGRRMAFDISAMFILDLFDGFEIDLSDLLVSIEVPGNSDIAIQARLDAHQAKLDAAAAASALPTTNPTATPASTTTSPTTSTTSTTATVNPTNPPPRSPFFSPLSHDPTPTNHNQELFFSTFLHGASPQIQEIVKTVVQRTQTLSTSDSHLDSNPSSASMLIYKSPQSDNTSAFSNTQRQFQTQQLSSLLNGLLGGLRGSSSTNNNSPSPASSPSAAPSSASTVPASSTSPSSTSSTSSTTSTVSSGLLGTNVANVNRVSEQTNDLFRLPETNATQSDHLLISARHIPNINPVVSPSLSQFLSSPPEKQQIEDEILVFNLNKWCPAVVKDPTMLADVTRFTTQLQQCMVESEPSYPFLQITPNPDYRIDSTESQLSSPQALKPIVFKNGLNWLNVTLDMSSNEYTAALIKRFIFGYDVEVAVGLGLDLASSSVREGIDTMNTNQRFILEQLKHHIGFTGLNIKLAGHNYFNDVVSDVILSTKLVELDPFNQKCIIDLDGSAILSTLPYLNARLVNTSVDIFIWDDQGVPFFYPALQDKLFLGTLKIINQQLFSPVQWHNLSPLSNDKEHPVVTDEDLYHKNQILLNQDNLDVNSDDLVKPEAHSVKTMQLGGLFSGFGNILSGFFNDQIAPGLTIGNPSSDSNSNVSTSSAASNSTHPRVNTTIIGSDNQTKTIQLPYVGDVGFNTGKYTVIGPTVGKVSPTQPTPLTSASSFVPLPDPQLYSTGLFSTRGYHESVVASLRISGFEQCLRMLFMIIGGRDLSCNLQNFNTTVLMPSAQALDEGFNMNFGIGNLTIALPK